ncbi:N-terminal EF-hand calcium-binding protein 2 [Striga asiatica]|uniref:N-terminal EF-hand calcium-binding protein 2 n=1 Tax=Striga asiatica TaxID=4170 RepID=A0A5A7QP05_STRAF|nr:N-terminal EF-hand calcium-binding protein 2 [Striga asiatica]
MEKGIVLLQWWQELTRLLVPRNGAVSTLLEIIPTSDPRLPTSGSSLGCCIIVEIVSHLLAHGQEDLTKIFYGVRNQKQNSSRFRTITNDNGNYSLIFYFLDLQDSCSLAQGVALDRSAISIDLDFPVLSRNGIFSINMKMEIRK